MHNGWLPVENNTHCTTHALLNSNYTTLSDPQSATEEKIQNEWRLHFTNIARSFLEHNIPVFKTIFKFVKN